MTVVTRFAPSPTGFLHIGGARTALFNWLYARHHGGRFLLRIEDTDQARSTPEATRAILDGLEWLALTPDAEPIFQSQRAARHAAVAHRLLAEGHAYRCYCTPEELTLMREQARAEKRPPRYDGSWRDRDPATAPAGVAPVIRLKTPRSGETRLDDLVQGAVTVKNDQLDDFILLRADGSPTYMLSVVADDHDMGITHVIRGDDHFTNAFRQYQAYLACGWEPPQFAHIPLIHGGDGAKLSKRHGALGVEAYREMGYLPEALCNALLRLSWARGDAERITREQAIAWFDLDVVGRAAARFDLDKLNALNAHYLKEAPAARLLELVAPRLSASLDDAATTRLLRGLDGLKQRARTVADLARAAAFYVTAPTLPPQDPKAARVLQEDGAAALLAALATLLATDATPWTEAALEAALREFAAARNVPLGAVAQPARVAMTGSHSSPGLFEVMAILGRAACVERLRAASAL